MLDFLGIPVSVCVGSVCFVSDSFSVFVIISLAWCHLCLAYVVGVMFGAWPVHYGLYAMAERLLGAVAFTGHHVLGFYRKCSVLWSSALDRT